VPPDHHQEATAVELAASVLGGGRRAHSVRNAVIGFTREARRATLAAPARRAARARVG
jgi:hypothetical protein